MKAWEISRKKSLKIIKILGNFVGIKNMSFMQALMAPIIPLVIDNMNPFKQIIQK